MNRLQIEHSIIGSLAMFKESYPIFRILRPKNFSHIPYREIYTVMLNMIPHTPIDLITLSDRMEYVKGESYDELILSCTREVLSHEHSVFWAFLLLEFDIRDKIIKALTPKKDNEIVSVVLKHISNRKNDLFKAIADSIELFKDNDMATYVEFMQTVYDGVDKKVIEMKRDDIVKHTNNFLTAIKNYNPF